MRIKSVTIRAALITVAGTVIVALISDIFGLLGAPDPEPWPCELFFFNSLDDQPIEGGRLFIEDLNSEKRTDDQGRVELKLTEAKKYRLVLRDRSKYLLLDSVFELGPNGHTIYVDPQPRKSTIIAEPLTFSSQESDAKKFKILLLDFAYVNRISGNPGISIEKDIIKRRLDEVFDSKTLQDYWIEIEPKYSLDPVTNIVVTEFTDDMAFEIVENTDYDIAIWGHVETTSNGFNLTLLSFLNLDKYGVKCASSDDFEVRDTEVRSINHEDCKIPQELIALSPFLRFETMKNDIDFVFDSLLLSSISKYLETYHKEDDRNTLTSNLRACNENAEATALLKLGMGESSFHIPIDRKLTALLKARMLEDLATENASIIAFEELNFDGAGHENLPLKNASNSMLAVGIDIYPLYIYTRLRWDSSSTIWTVTSNDLNHSNSTLVIANSSPYSIPFVTSTGKWQAIRYDEKYQVSMKSPLPLNKRSRAPEKSMLSPFNRNALRPKNNFDPVSEVDET